MPTGSVEVPFIFEELTSDFQTVTVQGQITYRIMAKILTKKQIESDYLQFNLGIVATITLAEKVGLLVV